MVPVTIAIPFYNAEKYLEDAIRSVFAQHHKDWELLLVDDFSSDSSLEIARSVRDERVRVITNPRNLKLASTLNRITHEAKFDLVARMDADDLMSPFRIQSEVEAFQKNPEIDVVSTGLYSIDSELRLVGKRSNPSTDFSVKNLLWQKSGLVHAAMMARRSWLLRNPYDFRLEASEDLDLWCQAASRGDLRALNLTEPLYIYREDQNITKQKLLNAYEIERKHLAHYLKFPVTRISFITRSLLKELAVNLLERRGNLNYLQNRRSTSDVTPADFEALQSIVDTIRATRVPGLN